MVGGEGSYRGHIVLKRERKHVGATEEQADGGAQAINAHGPDSVINQVVSVLANDRRACAPQPRCHSPVN